MSTNNSNKKRINVLVAADHAGYNGKIAGVGRYLLNVLPRLDVKRFNITLVILRDTASLETKLKQEFLKIITLNRCKFDPFTLYDFIKIIREERINILHLHQYGSSDFGRIAGKITGIPAIIHVHGPDLKYPVHQWLADRILSPLTHYAIAVSKSTQEECVRKRAIKVNKIIIMPNGIPLRQFNPLPAEKCFALKTHWNIPLNASVIGTITRLHKEKGNHYLLESAVDVLNEFPDTRFLFVGDGPLLGQLKEQARNLGIAHRVIFTGYQKKVSDMLSLFDITVMPSLSEGHPQALLEAMSMRKAIVATDVSGINEILMNGVTGILVPPRNPQALAEKIIHLLKNENERRMLGEQAFQESRKYSIDTHICHLEQIYAKETRPAHIQANNPDIPMPEFTG